MKQQKITLDREIYPRKNVDSKTTKAYKTAMDAGAAFPPIVIQRVKNYDEEQPDKEFLLLVDGAHRWRATGKGGEIECVHWKDDVLDYPDSKDALLLESYRLNATNPKNFTNSDKEDVARRIAENTPGFTDQELADELGIPRQTINRWVMDIRARQNASREAMIYRLSRLGWRQQDIADSVGLEDKSSISKMLQNAHLGKIQLNSEKSIEEQAEYHQYDLPTAYAMALEGKSDAERMDNLGINIQPYDVWNFAKANPMFGLNYPGRIPGELIAHVLYFFTEQGDVVLDPMSGGGTTQDVCLVMGRKCFAYDAKPDISRKDYMVHNLAEGWPEKIKKADLVFWDPPYFNKKDYHETSISHMELADYFAFMAKAIKEAFASAKDGATMAFLMSDWDDPDDGRGAFIWDYVKMIRDASWSLKKHIQVPLSTQQIHPDTVLKFRKSRRLARLERYLLIAVKE